MCPRPQTLPRRPPDAPETPPLTYAALGHIVNVKPLAYSTHARKFVPTLASTGVGRNFHDAPTRFKTHPDASKTPPAPPKSPPLASTALGGSSDVRADLQDLPSCFHGPRLASKPPEGICK